MENKEVKVYKGYVGFWKRVAAAIVDATPGTIVSFLLMFFLGDTIMDPDSFYADKAYYSDPFILYIILVAVSGLIIGIYHWYLYYKEGKGIGYKALGFKIIDQETGEKPSAKRLVLRVFYKYINIFLMIPVLIAFTIYSAKAFSGVGYDITGYAGAFMIFLFLFLFLFYLWPLILAISIGVSNKKRGFHDQWAKTIVVSEKNISSWKVWAINLGYIIFYISFEIFIIMSLTPSYG